MKTIIWDWNGTLLDDVQVSFDCLNEMLEKYHLPAVPSIDAYRSVFGFPVRDYYARVGIKGALFDEVAPQWMAAYMRSEIACPLREGAKDVLDTFHNAGFRQVILSASKRDNLLGQAARFDILHCFDTVLGLDHIYATSKEGIGREWMKASGIIPGDCIMIGDTLHDADVAHAMGCHCILVCGGHQLPETLKTAGVPVANTIQDAAKLILETGQNNII